MSDTTTSPSSAADDGATADPVRQVVPLGLHWPTIDPFLFCAHHDDAYPEAHEDLAPDPALLAGRDIGMDFEGRDGWRMYHGQRVPGFPVHPHRGFETVTYLRKGFCDHSDSLGAAARFGRGDVQWLTAGGGIQHSEMFPLLETDRPNPLELFQIWLNLPAADKMVDAHFTMFWDEDVPRVVDGPEGGPRTTVTVIAGRLGEVDAPTPPPASYASSDDADVAIWHVVLDPGATWTMPAAVGADTVRTLYVFDGDGSLRVAGHDDDIARDTGAVVDSQVALELSSDDGVELLVLQGRPLGEPVARYGPFVMTTEDEVRQAFSDYQRTRFGGWPWDDDDPAHPADAGRFARHADGRVEERGPA